MSSQEFHQLKVPLGDIISATDNFNPNNLIGHGGFGRVYKGELSLQKGRFVIAFKRLDPKLGQGNDEFWKEIIMLSRYRHENLVSLLCFCDEGQERILGYEFVSRGSLDSYLSDVSVTWTQRIKICLGVARALNYLHDPKETQERVLHRDIKSANILLDEEWNAKVSDFGLSKLGPANQPQTYTYSNPVGTPGYCDPLYWEIGYLTKESDVYSFGVILFEVMCGRLCYKYGNEILVNTWKNHYDENRLDDIVCSNLKEQMDSDSLITFSTVASRCLNMNRKERPSMSEIVKELEVALKEQNHSQSGWSLEELGRLAEPPLVYGSQEELHSLLSSGFRYKDTRWLSINKNERVCETISIIECITFNDDDVPLRKRGSQGENSRFDHIIGDELPKFLKLNIRTQFLIPRITYNINLIHKYKLRDHATCVPFKYKPDEEVDYSAPFIPEVREDGWLITRLYQFTCHQREQHFTIECLPLKTPSSLERHIIEGIELCPVEYEIQEKNTVNILDTDWEEKFPLDYVNLIKLSKDTKQWTTKKELYSILRQGFPIDNGEKWLSITKNMEKRIMISPTAAFDNDQWIWNKHSCSLESGSRFNVVAKSHAREGFLVSCKIKSQMLSRLTTYSCHLIYKLPENYSSPQCVVTVCRLSPVHFFQPWYIYLMPPHTPIIGSNVDGNPSYTRKIAGHPKMRKDGWMECQIWEVSTRFRRTISVNLVILAAEVGAMIVDLVVQGIEFRPL